MAMNLADFEGRKSRQSRQTNGRGDVLPRPDTRAPALQGSASMQTASRGDAGAQELMQTLGMVEKGAQSFQSYANGKFAKDEERNAAQGATDEMSGHVDPELMAKSAAYKTAVSQGRTMTAWDDGLRQFDEDLRGFIEQQDDEHLDVRLAQVNQRVDEFYRDFATDPETGTLKEFLSTPGAMRYLSERMKQTRAQVAANASSRVEQRFKGEALGHYAAKLRSQALGGLTLDLTEARSALPDTISSDEIRSTYVATVISAATELEASGRYEDARRLTNQALGLAAIPLPEVAQGDPSSPLSAPATDGKPARVEFSTLLSAVRSVESGGDPNAVSPKGALGAMQTMPGTLRDPGFGVSPAKDGSPAELERVGRAYLKAMLARYNGSYVKALAAYNAGPGKVDEWIAHSPKASDAEFVSAIPYGETRDYVGNVLARAGLAGPSDPVAANPEFRLLPEELDPVKRADADPRLALAPQLTGDLELHPEERARLLEFRQTLGNRISDRWDREHREAQDELAGDFLLRLNGQGTPATSQEVAEAARKRLISPQQAASLFNLIRSNAADAENSQDRAIARADREEARRQEQETELIASHYLGSIASGRESPQAARARLLQDVTRIADPEVRRRVVQQVGEFANTYESVRTNSEPMRAALGQFDDLEARQRDALAGTALGSRRQAVTSRWASEVDVSRSRFARRVLAGEDPSKVYADERSRLAGVYARLTERPSRPTP